MYKEQSLNTVQEANLLTGEDFKVLTDLKDELQSVFNKVQVYRTKTEMEISILNDMDFPTADAKYWQAIREQNGMFESLVHMSFEYRRTLVELKKIERQLEKENDDLEKELLQIKKEEILYSKLFAEREAKDRIREIKEWEEIKKNLLHQMSCSISNANEHQLFSYTCRWIQQFTAIMHSGGGNSVSEMHNLVAQLDKGLKACQERNLMPKLIEKFGFEIMQGLQNPAVFHEYLLTTGDA